MPHDDGPVDDGLGAQLRVHRQRALLSQEQLAERAQLSVRAIRDIERALSGDVTAADLRRVLAGAHPTTGDALTAGGPR